MLLLILVVALAAQGVHVNPSTTVVRLMQIEDKVIFTAVKPFCVSVKTEITGPFIETCNNPLYKFTAFEGFPAVFVDTARCHSLRKWLKVVCSFAELQFLSLQLQLLSGSLLGSSFAGSCSLPMCSWSSHIIRQKF